MRGMIVAASFGAALAGFVVEARADDIHVPRDFRRLQAALDAAKPGDRVLVDRGTHRGSFRVNTGGIEILGAPKARIVGRHTRTRRDEVGLTIQGDDVSVRGLAFVSVGIRAEGSRNTVEGCTFLKVGEKDEVESVVSITGDGAIVAGNLVDGTCSVRVAVQTTGLNGTISGNRLEAEARERGISVAGAGATIVDNEVTLDTGAQGVWVIGDTATVSGNVLSGGNILIRGDGGLLEGNEVSGVLLGQASIHVVGDEGALVGNAVTGGFDTGIFVQGDRNDIVENTVTGNGILMNGTLIGHGIVVRGATNVLLRDRVVGCVGEAFRLVGNDTTRWVIDPATHSPVLIFVVPLPGNAVVESTATGAGRCGLGNWTFNSAVTGSEFTGNGVDVVSGNEFTEFEGNTWQSGGPDYSGAGDGVFTADVWGQDVFYGMD